MEARTAQVTTQVTQSVLILVLGIPALLLLIALFGWIASLILQAITGYPPPDI